MAQFISSNPKLEVNNFVIIALTEVLGGLDQKLENLFYKEEIVLKNRRDWYKLQSYLNVLKDVSIQYGPNILFKLGKSVGKSLQFSNKVNSIQEAFETLESSFQNLHQNGFLGSYKLIKFDKTRQEARFECQNPYPCYFDRGLITQVTRQFMPKTANLVNVELNNRLPSRLSGSDKSFYTVFWM